MPFQTGVFMQNSNAQGTSKAPLVPDGRLQTVEQPQSQGPRPWLWQALRPPCHHTLPAVPAAGGHELPPQSLQPSIRKGSALPLSWLMTARKLHGKCNLHGVCDTLHNATQQYAAPHHMVEGAAGPEASTMECF